MMMNDAITQNPLKTTTSDSFCRSSSCLRRCQNHHGMFSSMFQIETPRLCDANDEDEEINQHKSFLQEVEDWNIQIIIDRALNIAVEEATTDEWSTSWDDVEEEKEEDCSCNSTSCRTVDSLVLTHHRLPNLVHHASPEEGNGTIPSDIVVALKSGQSSSSPLDEERLVVPLRSLEEEEEDDQLEPLSMAQPCLGDLAARRCAVHSNNNHLMVESRNVISPSMKIQARECLPELVRVETDESLQYGGLDDDDDDDDNDETGVGGDDDSFVSFDNDVFLGEDKDSDCDPFDEEIDSIVLNKRWMAKQKIHSHTIDQEYGDKDGYQLSR